MIRKQFFWFIGVVVLVAAACNLPVGLGGSDATPQPLAMETLAVLTPQALPPDLSNCTSPLTPGLWSGQGTFQYSGTTAGITVLEHQAPTPLQIEIGCDGSVTGVAESQSSSTVNYPFLLSGSCSGASSQDVSGNVIMGPSGLPVLQLTFSLRQGRMTCEVDSRLSDIPTGTQEYDLTGQSYTANLVAETATGTQVSGNQWPDFMYEQLQAELGPALEQSGVTGTVVSGWQLTRQP